MACFISDYLHNPVEKEFLLEKFSKYAFNINLIVLS